MRARFRSVMLIAVLTLLMLHLSVPAYAVTDRTPDLRMARLSELQIEKTGDGHRRLRFSTKIVNVGVGAFEVWGSRSTTSDPMTVAQRIYDDAGSYTVVSTPATMVFGGDGHYHWHVRNLERYTLDRLDNGVRVGTGAKSGFCFYDNVQFNLSLPGAPQNAVYTSQNSCASGQSNAVGTNVAREGLSVGWGDAYWWNLPDQYIDITGLGSGRYRLRAIADPDNWFKEIGDTNNETWVDLQFQGSGAGLKILGYGPSA